MSRTEEEPMVRVHIWIFKRDYDRIMSYFNESLGFSRASRMMLRKFLDNLEAQTDANARRPQALDSETQADLFAGLSHDPKPKP